DLLVSGKITSGFHVLRYLALGADGCYSARGMMFALGCVQALQCDRDTCPTGITTTNEKLANGLVPEDKKQRVFNYHKATIAAVKDMLMAAGLNSVNEVSRSLICRRTNANTIKTLEELYPSVQEGALLKQPVPEAYRRDMAVSDAGTFSPLSA
ncbi:MAG: glutamate synthase-related protein, partial [Bacteroidia bacterium]